VIVIDIFITEESTQGSVCNGKGSEGCLQEFQEVDSLYEKGSLKDKKVRAGEVLRGFVSLKQWYIKPLCSLSDEQFKLCLLRKVK